MHVKHAWSDNYVRCDRLLMEKYLVCLSSNTLHAQWWSFAKSMQRTTALR
jgi:hypothetical protein